MAQEYATTTKMKTCLTVEKDLDGAMVAPVVQTAKLLFLISTLTLKSYFSTFRPLLLVYFSRYKVKLLLHHNTAPVCTPFFDSVTFSLDLSSYHHLQP